MASGRLPGDFWPRVPGFVPPGSDAQPSYDQVSDFEEESQVEGLEDVGSNDEVAMKKPAAKKDLDAKPTKKPAKKPSAKTTKNDDHGGKKKDGKKRKGEDKEEGDDSTKKKGDAKQNGKVPEGKKTGKNAKDSKNKNKNKDANDNKESNAKKKTKGGDGANDTKKGKTADKKKKKDNDAKAKIPTTGSPKKVRKAVKPADWNPGDPGCSKCRWSSKGCSACRPPSKSGAGGVGTGEASWS